MLIPPNYGPRYSDEFRDMFPALAKKHAVALVPFLLDQVALNASLMLPDGIHPNEAGQPRIIENVWPHLKPLLVAAGKPPG
jgi:acyl-CoA thioesterase-1